MNKIKLNWIDGTEADNRKFSLFEYPCLESCYTDTKIGHFTITKRKLGNLDCSIIQILTPFGDYTLGRDSFFAIGKEITIELGKEFVEVWINNLYDNLQKMAGDL